MPKVWLLARRAFTFKGTSYQEGQRFQADQLAAIQMHATRAVHYAKAPAAVAPAAPPSGQPQSEGAGSVPRRRYVRRTEPPPVPTAIVNHNIEEATVSVPHVQPESATSATDPQPE